MRLLTSASGLKVRSGSAWLLTLASLSLPLGLLTGCNEPSATTKGSSPISQTKREGELAYVTDDELARFVDGTPDHSTIFPEENFVKGRKLLEDHKYSESEKLLRDGLGDAVKSSAGETKLGQYCIRLDNVLYQEATHLQGQAQQNEYKDALKYAILASKIFYKQPPAQRPMPFWFFNDHMHMGFCYKGLGHLPEAEANLRKAINVASSAPAGQEDWPFHRLCYLELIDALQKDKSIKDRKQITQVKEELKSEEAKHSK